MQQIPDLIQEVKNEISPIIGTIDATYCDGDLRSPPKTLGVVQNAKCVVQNANEIAKHIIIETISIAYGDVLHRGPSAQEIESGISVALLTLDGVLRFYQDLLCSEEFLLKFALAMPPALVARILINQLTGQAPLSQEEINAVAGKILEAGWLAFVKKLLTQPPIQQRILTDVRRRAQHIRERAADDATSLLPEAQEVIVPTATSASSRADARPATAKTGRAPAPVPRPPHKLKVPTSTIASPQADARPATAKTGRAPAPYPSRLFQQQAAHPRTRHARG